MTTLHCVRPKYSEKTSTGDSWENATDTYLTNSKKQQQKKAKTATVEEKFWKNHTPKARRKKIRNHNKFAPRWAQIVSRQRQEVRAKSTTITHQNSFAINLKRKNRYRVSFRTTLCETQAKLQANKALTLTLQRYSPEPYILGYQGPSKSFSCGRHSTIPFCKPLGKNACSLR